MKCQSVACLWSGALPSHRVTAAAILSRPPTLYTGGSDGSIVWWNHSSSESNLLEIKPIAMLCGHAAPIADLAICNPVVVAEPGNVPDHSSKNALNSTFDGCTALISACSDGVLCVWSRSSGHCRSRRPLKFMVVVQLTEERESLLMADSSGRLQLVPLSKESQTDVEGVSVSGKSSLPFGDVLIEGEKAISVIAHQKVVAFLSTSRCIFWLLSHGDAIGEISLDAFFQFPEVRSFDSYVAGAMFLDSCDARDAPRTQDDLETLSEKFIVWDIRGFAVVYDLSYTKGEFKSEQRGEITACSHCLNVKSSFCFIQLKHYLLRIGSICFDVEEPFQWRPYVTIWSLCHGDCDDGDISLQCKMLGEGSYFTGWFLTSSSDLKNLVSKPSSTSHLSYQLATDISGKNYGCEKGRVVSSSMVISENLFAPYAVVYGFFSGEIEILRFDMLRGLDSPAGSPRLEADSLVSSQQFLGHTGAVLCLAAHRMFGAAKGWSFSHVLISGSMDCTVRIWDLDSGNVIMIMHHHVAPVRQIILSPARTERPWSDCFLTVGEDSCVAVSSLETLRVERMFPGHPSYPTKVVWDGSRGYVACLCRCHSRTLDAVDVVYIWDVKAGSRERILQGTASHLMFDHFCEGISMQSISGTVLSGNTSVSSLLFPVEEEKSSFYMKNYERAASSSTTSPSTSQESIHQVNFKEASLVLPSILQSKRYPPIKCTCPFPGISALTFDLLSLAVSCQTHEDSDKHEMKEEGTETSSSCQKSATDNSSVHMTSTDSPGVFHMAKAIEKYLIRFSLSFLHLWGIDSDLDQLLLTQMKLKKPQNFIVASGLQGDKGSLTLMFPGLSASLELWKSSSEFCAMRSLMMVSLAQCMTSLSCCTSAASSALAAFYTRSFVDKFPDLKPPLLQLLVTFWQDKSEHVRMAARLLFHCAASRAIPAPLCSDHASEHVKLMMSLSGYGENEAEISGTGESSTNHLESENLQEAQRVSQAEEAELHAWLESFEMQDWISCVGGTSQDAMASHIIVAAALSIWYPSLVKPTLPMLVVHPLTKLVMSMNKGCSSTAAELLAEGMETTWKPWIVSDLPRLISDIFFQIECVSSPSANSVREHKAVPASIKQRLVGVLLPSLAMADILGFLTVTESQIWATASDSPIHLVSLKTLIRVMHTSPRNVVQHLDKVVNFILQTMDPSNSVMRKTCLQTSVATLKEVVRVFPMVVLNDASTRLAVGDAVAQINDASIRIYDMQSLSKIKVLDASGPPGLPSLLGGASETVATTGISALSFSPDGEGLVAFSENGLMIRWWSLGSVWWEKLSRSFTPVHCTKLIFVPPWEGFIPNSSRSSVISGIMRHEKEANTQESGKNLSQADHVQQLVRNCDLSYRLKWVGERKVLLTRHGVNLGTFPF